MALLTYSSYLCPFSLESGLIVCNMLLNRFMKSNFLLELFNDDDDYPFSKEKNKVELLHLTVNFHKMNLSLLYGSKVLLCFFLCVQILHVEDSLDLV